MWAFKREFREKLNALLGDDALTDKVMAMVEAEIDSIEEAHWYDTQEAIERAADD